MSGYPVPQTTITRNEKTVEGAGKKGYETVQYTTTIPKHLGEALDIEDGQQVEWKVTDGNNLLMKIQDQQS